MAREDGATVLRLYNTDVVAVRVRACAALPLCAARRCARLTRTSAAAQVFPTGEVVLDSGGFAHSVRPP